MIRDLDCSNCLIRSISCFHALSEEDILFMNKDKFSTLYPKGQIIFHEGRFPTGIYCLKSGKVKISKTGIDGKEQIVRFVVPGGLLGIRALVSGRQYMANATTLDDSVVCYIGKPTFFEISTKYPEVSQCVLKTLSRLLEEAEERMTSLAQKHVRERLAESLLVLDNIFRSEKCPVERSTISLSREDLANIVGTATETVIRLLSEFREENLITIVGRKIVLMNIPELQRIAGRK